MLAHDFLLPSAPFEAVFFTVLEEFRADKEIGIFTADRAPLTAKGERQPYSAIAMSIRALLKLATPTRQPLNVAIFALLVLYLGRLRGDNELLETSRRAYGSILDKTRAILSELSDTGRHHSHHWTPLVCQIVVLRLFEVSYD